MKAQVAIQKILRDRYQEGRRTNPRYSLRAFSRKVGIHFAALSSIINGKRNVSRKLASRIAGNLCLDPQERAELLELFPAPKRTTGAGAGLVSGEVIEPSYFRLNAEQFKIAAEWEHFAVLSLMQCADFVSDPAWIARRLAITEVRSKRVIDRLLELDLVAIDVRGNLTRSARNYRTPDDVASASLKKCHDQTLELARESLYRDSVEARDFTSVTVPVNPQTIRAAKELIRKFEDEFCDQVEAGERTEVYRLAVQFFPLTRLNQGDLK